MITIIAGGKKNKGEYGWLISDYEKRMRKPYDFSFKFYEGEKLDEYLSQWPFSGNQYVIVADERGEIASSPEMAERLDKVFDMGKEVVIIIGGAFGVSKEVRERADFVWSFSRLVFPHMIARLIVAEQLYRAQEINKGGSYHHD
ncbi:23S rRNA (pseudouridine(1915)-N(3))-methyltransferase RlmH [Candidatus Saccharibacteria bacterium]|nr:23S rRNA (pseudouridine(1915)-N(3))-methyltransferase RlmH [Candidatus Saccharibacteria bacterium]